MAGRKGRMEEQREGKIMMNAVKRGEGHAACHTPFSFHGGPHTDYCVHEWCESTQWNTQISVCSMYDFREST